MTAEQRRNLLELHRNAVNTWGKAAKTNQGWQEAFDADDAFTAALYNIEVTE